MNNSQREHIYCRLHPFENILANIALKYNSELFAEYNILVSKNTIYKRIRDLREDADISQTQMGKHLSCSQRVYSNYERGDIDIPTPILVAIAEFHGVSVDYLLDLTDNPKRNK